MRRYQRTRIAFDMSSLLWTALRAGCGEGGREVINEETGKPEWVNTAAYCVDIVINMMTSEFAETGTTPIDALLVFEGVNSKARRLMLSSEYKKNRGKRSTEAREEFATAKSAIQEIFRNLGAATVIQDNVEADDVFGYLAQQTSDKLIVVSYDSDLAVLSSGDGRIVTRINKRIDENPFGIFPAKYISLYKAMVGDTSDSISGIKGFGKSAWMDFHREFGEAGMAELTRLAESGTLRELADEALQHKLINKIYSGEADFLRSYKLAKLHPEWVDTLQDPISIVPGMVCRAVNDKRLNAWRAARKLVTADKWDEFFPWFKSQLEVRPFLSLDIETTQPEESDEWLLAQGEADGVDPLGSTTTGMSLTFGSNMQYTVYISVNHAGTNNVPREKLVEILRALEESGVEVAIQNVQFEGPVLHQEFGEQLHDNGFDGFVPNWTDTAIEANYVDENYHSTGLKQRAKLHLGYEQADYKSTVTVWVPAGEVHAGKFVGQRVREVSPAEFQVNENGINELVKLAESVREDGYQMKMHQLSAEHVFDYACDDTVVTAALHNYYHLVMDLEGSLDEYYNIEVGSSYLHARGFLDGVPISLAVLRELEVEDQASYDSAWATLAAYLTSKGWDGTTCPQFEVGPSAAEVKAAYQIVTGEPLDCKFRKLDKLASVIREQGHETLAFAVEQSATDVNHLNNLVRANFKGEVQFNLDSSPQKCRLLYEVMELPVRLRNALTDVQKAAGQTEGNPKADNLAITYALIDTPEEDPRHAVLEAIRVCMMVNTRQKIYYKPYPNFVHWKTGRVHSSHRQASTNTRRGSSAKPNVQQVAKNEKVEGYLPRIREVYVPHKPGALVVSMDFKAQELRVIADYSRDDNMLACYIGDNKKDMHAFTGVGIFRRKSGLDWSYEVYSEALDSKDNPQHALAKRCRALGKQTNFTTEFGAAAPKLATVLLVTEDEAQSYMDAKEAAFPGVRVWKDATIAEAKANGFVTTKSGVRRHLRDLLLSRDRYTSSKAERQAVNFKVQGSSAEMTKKAESRIWEKKLWREYDMQYYFPVHDEIVFSVTIEDLLPVLEEMHWCMVQPYGGMFVPIESSISFGPSFGPGHQIEIGDAADEQAVAVGLAEVRNLLERIRVQANTEAL